MTVQTSLRNLLQKPSLLVNTPRARKREGKKERERERRGEERKEGVPSYEQSSRDTPKEILSIMFKKTPESKERKGEGRGRRGLSSPQVPMNLKLALTAVVTLCPADAVT